MKKSIIYFKLISFILLFIGFHANAFQGEFSTPRLSVNYLEKYTSSKSANYVKASKLISPKIILSAKKRRQSVKDIRSILDALNYQWLYDSIPDSSSYVSSTSKDAVYVLTADITLEKQGDDWLISKHTIDNIPTLLNLLGLKSSSDLVNQTNENLENEKISDINSNAEWPTINLDLSSPRSLVLAFRKYMSENEWRPDVAQQIIYYKHLPHLEERIDRVIKLRRFIDGKGLLFNINGIPNNPDYIDTLHAGLHEYVLTSRYAELYLEKIGDRWYLSKETVEKIPALFEFAFPFGSDKLLHYFPNNQTKYLGLMVWQYLAILGLIIFGFTFNKVLNWGVHYLITKILFKVGKKKNATTYIKPVVRPFSLMVALLLASMFLPILQLPLKVSYYISLAIDVFIPFFGTIGSYKTIDIVALYFEKLALKTESTLDDQLVPLFRKIAKTFIIIFGSVFILANLNVQLVPLLATLSIGGLAFALAAQDTIKNFFGSLMIFVDKPFQVGQWITASGIDGTVEEVGIRSTRIRTFSNSLIYVPNGKLADATIDNHGLRTYRRYATQLAIKYETPPETIELFIEGLRKIVMDHPDTWKENALIYLNEMNSHSLDIKFYIFFAVPTWAEELKARHEIIMLTLKLAQKLGVQFAFPTQTLHVQDFPGKPTLTPEYLKPDKLKKEMDGFFDENSDKR